jgi:hypothetical protein
MLFYLLARHIFSNQLHWRRTLVLYIFLVPFKTRLQKYIFNKF